MGKGIMYKKKGERRMKRGDKVRYDGCSEAQQKWGNYNDHSKLVIGGIYTVSKIEAHSWHTNVHLKGIDGRFNSVCFTVFETQKRTYKNVIRFNCTAFVKIKPLQPSNCYNCGYRDGYPQNLGGDEDCKNYLPKTIN